MRTTGGMLVAAGLGACSTERMGPVKTGTVEVKITGLDASATDGGTAVVTPQDGSPPISLTLPASGDQTAPAPVGTYSVAYTPPANHQLAPGQPNPQTVVISEGVTTTVTFALVFVPPATTGTIQINVTGLSGSPANGGSAVAQRTDAAGAPITISISAAGSGSNSSVPAGTYSVTYTPPGGFSVSGTNPVTGVVVGVGATAVVAFAVQALPTTGTLQITVTGLTGSPPDGGSVVAQRTDAQGSPITINISAAGNGSNSLVPIGTYTVTYTPPSGFAVASGTVNPKTGVSVGPGTTTSVTFSVQVAQTTGAIQVNVSGLTGSPANGGSAVAQRTDASGAPITINVSAAGSGNVSGVPAGTYTITYTPPAGFTVSGSVNPQTGVAVVAGSTTTVSFTVAVSSGGVPGNIYEFGFEDGTAGSLVDTSIHTIVVGAGHPWSIDSTTAYRGSKSMTQVVPAATFPNDNGADAYFQLPSNRTSIYVRWGYKQSADPGNFNKMLRLKGPGLSANLGGVGGSQSGTYQIGTDSLASGSPLLAPNVNLPAPTIADNLGTWHCFEYFCDISTPGAVIYRLWIDGTLYWDYTRNDDPGSNVFAYVQFSGTKNATHAAFQEWLDSIGISSAPMGVPA